jgi:hypothetical protein
LNTPVESTHRYSPVTRAPSVSKGKIRMSEGAYTPRTELFRAGRPIRPGA